MTPTDHKPGDLLLFVRAENVELECGKCKSIKATVPCYKGTYGEDIFDSKHIDKGCSQCHGTSTHTVTLEGNVGPIRITAPFLSSATSIQISCDGKLWPPDNSAWTGKSLHDQITKALNDNTCPDEIRTQLSEVKE